MFKVANFIYFYSGVSSPRTFDSSGTELPSPRVISMNVFSDGDRPLSNITSLLMQFGQFVNHDLESTSTFTFRKRKTVDKF